MGEQSTKPIDRLMKLLARADDPFDEDSVAMDCTDGCEDIAHLAERVANGEQLKDILPNFADHMEQIGCCKQEFDALVSVIKAERAILAGENTAAENEKQPDKE